MMCFPSYTAEQIQDALNDSKTAFCNSITADKPANLEQCTDALKVAVGTLAKLKKKRALNKAQNSTLKKEIEDAYQELTQLQGYPGSDKAQKCLELARKWRSGVNIPQPQPEPEPEPKPKPGSEPEPQPQPQPQPQLESGPEPGPQPQSSDNETDESDRESMASDDSNNVPTEFFPATMAPTSGGVPNYGEDDPVGDTPRPKEAELNVPQVELFNGEPSDPNQSHLVNPSEQYVKNAGDFADAAPREQPSIEDLSEGPLPDTSSVGPEDVDPAKEQTEEADEDKSKTVVIAERTDSGGRIVTTERGEEGSLRHVVTGITPGTTTIRVTAERAETGEEILAPVDAPKGDEREVITELDADGRLRYIIGGPTTAATTSSSIRIVSERTLTGEIRHVIVGGFSGNAIRVITERSSAGELRMTPTTEETGELRRVITERTETGEDRYVVGDIISSQPTTGTRALQGPRIVSERTSTGEIRYVIVDQYNGSAIRTKFERDEMTGEYRHIPVREPEGELRYVNEERTETGEIRKVIGGVITGNVRG
ncbi:MAG: hypothetical protein J3Q66DRAFT_397802 [Benniella sp.]|nr:MAG: hypothetical protein J3Q66DRAFT_397802 [Benniella sp.]